MLWRIYKKDQMSWLSCPYNQFLNRRLTRTLVEHLTVLALEVPSAVPLRIEGWTTESGMFKWTDRMANTIFEWGQLLHMGNSHWMIWEDSTPLPFKILSIELTTLVNIKKSVFYKSPLIDCFQPLKAYFLQANTKHALI